jgi:Methane oxygenase PmoA
MVYTSRMALMLAWLMCSGRAPCSAEVTAERSERGVVVKIDGALFTEYLTEAGESPAMWPIIGPTGKPMTRSYPVGPREKGETDDHPHHQSLWFTHDEVNDANFWSDNRNDRPDGSRAHVKHREFDLAHGNGGSSTAHFVARNDWMKGDKKLFEDARAIVCGVRENGDRWIDFTITIKATEGDATFGDTKEGTFAVRVADTMRLEAKQGGQIINSEGQIDDEAWGMPAKWVDYTGPVEGETVGIAILCHPKSFRPNTRWHVRGYGLFAANPFGHKDFPKPELAKQGAVTIPKGDELTLRYRVLLHRGSTDKDEIEKAYEEFAAN